MYKFFRNAKTIDDCYSGVLLVHMLATTFQLCFETFQVFTVIKIIYINKFNPPLFYSKKIIYLLKLVLISFCSIMIYCYKEFADIINYYMEIYELKNVSDNNRSFGSIYFKKRFSLILCRSCVNALVSIFLFG